MRPTLVNRQTIPSLIGGGYYQINELFEEDGVYYDAFFFANNKKIPDGLIDEDKIDSFDSIEDVLDAIRRHEFKRAAA